MGRFCERGEDADMSAAIFHEQCAAELGIKEAIVTLASIHLGLPHELLVNVYLEVSLFPAMTQYEFIPVLYAVITSRCTTNDTRGCVYGTVYH